MGLTLPCSCVGSVREHANFRPEGTHFSKIRDLNEAAEFLGQTALVQLTQASLHDANRPWPLQHNAAAVTARKPCDSPRLVLGWLVILFLLSSFLCDCLPGV